MPGSNEHISRCSLPLAAWQVIAQYLPADDALAARLVCSTWAQDLGAFIQVAKAVPIELLSAAKPPQADHSNIPADQGASLLLLPNSNTSHAPTLAEAAENPTSEAPAAEQPSAAAAGSSVVLQRSRRPTVQQLLDAFPHCECLHVDVSSTEQQQLAALLLNSLAGSSSRGNSSSDNVGPSTSQGTCTTPGVRSQNRQFHVAHVAPTPDHNQQTHQFQQQQQQRQGPRVCLAAVPRSFHCKARQDCPMPAAGAAGALFQLLTQLPRQLSPPALSAIRTLDLDSFPTSPEAWGVLKGLTCLRELLLPPFKPALPHTHLPALASLTQLTSLTASVQGSVTSWRSCCESFGSLSSLTRLQHLSLHAFHCPGRSLAAGLSRLVCLTELRLSGRVVLTPVQVVGRLRRLRTLELTQDMQYSVLCDLCHSLPHLTQLAVGRITLPPPTHSRPGHGAAVAAAVAAAAAAEADQWPLPAAAAVAAVQMQAAPAAAAAGAGGDAGVGNDDSGSDSDDDLLPELLPAAGAQNAAGGAGPAPPAAAAAAAAVAGPAGPLPVPVWPFLAAAAQAPAPDPGEGVGGGGAGGGEVMLEDVGLIVDGLVGNLQEGAIPAHLQHIIERFESIIQLDLTRRGSSSPWAWPTGGLGLLQVAAGLSGWLPVAAGPESNSSASLGSPAAAAAAGEEEEAQGGGGVGCELTGQAGVGLEQQGAAASQTMTNTGSGSGVGRQTGRGAGWSDSVCWNRSACEEEGPLKSLELALLKPSDVARLVELPAELRATQHLGMRLRDQLLAFASVCALKLEPGQLAPLGYTFQHLSSLSLSGKVSLDGPMMTELTSGLGGSSGSRHSGSNGRSSSSSSSSSGGGSSGSSRGLLSLCLDVHFVGVGAVDVTAALKAVPCLQALSLRHRGAGKLVVPVAALPISITVLALKKVMLYCSSSSSSSSSTQTAMPNGGCLGRHSAATQPSLSSSSSRCDGNRQQQQQQQTMGVQVEGSGLELPGLSQPSEMTHPSEMSHAILSPGFNRAALAGSISAPDLPSLLGTSLGVTAVGGLGAQSYAAAAAAAGHASAGSSSTNAGGGSAADSCSISSSVGCSSGKMVSHQRLGEGLAAAVEGLCGGEVPLLPNLRRLYLKLCFVPLAALNALLGSSHAYAQQQQQQQQPECVGCQRCGSAGSSSSSGSSGGDSSSSTVGQAGVRPLAAGSSLEVLSVTGDGVVRGEVCEVWAGWLQALKHQRGLQVLELTVPEHLGSSLPPALLTTLQSLPRLAHLHLTTSGTPHQLIALTTLKHLRTLSMSYTGPPCLPSSLLNQLQSGLGPYCRVQLWEQVVMQHQDTFGGGGGGGAGVGAGEQLAGGQAEAGGLAGGPVANAALQQVMAMAPDALPAAAVPLPAGLVERGQGGAQGRSMRGLVRRGVGVVLRSRACEVLRLLSGGCLVFEVGRQLGWLAAKWRRADGLAG